MKSIPIGAFLLNQCIYILIIAAAACDATTAAGARDFATYRFWATDNRIIIQDRELNERVRLQRNEFTERILKRADELFVFGGVTRVDDYADGWLDAMAYIYVEGAPAEVLIDSTR